MPYLYLIKSRAALKPFRVKLPLMTIGHHLNADLLLPPAARSCACSYFLAAEEGELRLKLGRDAKPFFLNSEKEKKAPLHDGDLLSLCQNHFLFSAELLPAENQSLTDLIPWVDPLSQLMQTLHQPSSWADLFVLLLKNARLLTQAEKGFVLAINFGAPLSIAAKEGVSEAEIGEVDALLSDPMISQALRIKRPIYSHNPLYASMFQASPIVLESHAASAVCLPILAEKSGQPLGLLFLLSQVPFLFDAAKSSLLELYTELSAMAILKSRNEKKSIPQIPTPTIKAEIPESGRSAVAQTTEQISPVLSTPQPPKPQRSIENFLRKTVEESGERIPSLDEAISLFRNWYIKNALELCDHNRTHAAKLLGISVRSMFRYVAAAKEECDPSQASLPLEETKEHCLTK